MIAREIEERGCNWTTMGEIEDVGSAVLSALEASDGRRGWVVAGERKAFRRRSSPA